MTVIPWSFRAIAMKGIYSGIPLETYHAGNICVEPSISSSGLRTIFGKSAKHYWCSSPYNKDRIEPDETKSMLQGRAAHHLLFGEADFRKLFVVRPATINGEAWHGSKTICKGWIKAAEAKGLTVLTPDQLETIKGIAGSLAEEPLVRAGILNGLIEHSWFWKDTETGAWLKARPDASPNDSLDFADLKLTTSVLWHDLQRTIQEYGYHQQGALIGTACKEVLGKPMNSFSLVFVENKPPYCVQAVTLKDEDLHRGARANRVALRSFADCLKAKHWPGPGGDQNDARYIELPTWAQTQIDERLEIELGKAST